MISKLLIITTGGTIDKIYFDDKSDYQIGEPQISQILHAMHVAFEVEVSALMRKDSLHIGDKERQPDSRCSRGLGCQPYPDHAWHR